MRFKTGDKVKFLNENGGGTVIAIIDQRLVKIETDDGFEMPVLSSELIKDFRAEGQQPQEDPVFPQTPQQPEAKEEPEESFVSDINPWGEVKEVPGIYLAFEPHEQQWVLTGDLDVFLINNTSYELLYSLFLEKENGPEGVDYGSVPPNSKLVLETIPREEIENWTKGFLQTMLHSDRPQKIYLPVNTELRIKSQRFFKEGSYQSNTLLQGKALLVSVVTLSEMESVASGDSRQQKFGTTASSGSASVSKEKPFIDKHRTSSGVAVVDLHIGEIVDNIAGLSSTDMFNLQMNYFRKALESAIKNDYHKVTFIHGVGNGVLKNAIIKEMEDYEQLENRMASISKFGVGAVDVLIKTKD